MVCVMACLCGMASCADTEMVQLQMEEPQSLASTDYLKAYQVLKSYISPVAVNISPEALATGGMEYRIAIENFSELVPGYAFTHQRMIKANGSIDSTTILAVRNIVQQQGMSLVGGPLIWHEHQNATYLNSKLSPNIIRPEGDEGGYCVKMTNTAKSANYADEQVAFTFARTPQVEPGIKYKLKMMVRGTAEGQVQMATFANSRTSRFSPTVTITKDWTSVETITTMAAGIRGLSSILFNLGQYVGTLYADNIELYEVDSKGNEVTDNLCSTNTGLDDAETTAGSMAVQTDINGSLEDVGISSLGEGFDPLAIYVEKTAEEKQSILTAEMQRYIAGTMTAGGSQTTDWIVVQNALDSVTDDASLFYWQSYLGEKTYAVDAFRIAAQQSGSARLFIGESSVAHVRALIDYVATLEAQGARVDGFALNIAAQLSDSVGTTFADAFAQLGATGKWVKISDLSVVLPDSVTTDNVTSEMLRQQASIYANILRAYAEHVPSAQRAGIVQHQIFDDDRPLGLWNRLYERKPAYGGFVDGITK